MHNHSMHNHLKCVLTTLLACALLGHAQTETKGKPGIVVLPARATQGLVADMAKNRDAGFSRVMDALNGHLEAAVASSRKFTVLERQGLKDLLDDPAKLGNSLQLRPNDYGMLITINSFVDQSEQFENLVRRRVQISGTVKIVGGITAEVLDISDIQISTNMLRQIVEGVQSTRPIAEMDAILPDAARAFTDASVARLLGVVFPAKVIDVDGTTLTVNRGSGYFKNGEIVKIYGAEKIKVDPDTGEQIRIKGKLIGEVKVTDVDITSAQLEAPPEMVVVEGAVVRK